jgi:hypothetical protein
MVDSLPGEFRAAVRSTSRDLRAATTAQACGDFDETRD